MCGGFAIQGGKKTIIPWSALNREGQNLGGSALEGSRSGGWLYAEEWSIHTYQRQSNSRKLCSIDAIVFRRLGKPTLGLAVPHVRRGREVFAFLSHFPIFPLKMRIFGKPCGWGAPQAIAPGEGAPSPKALHSLRFQHKGAWPPKRKELDQRGAA